MKRGNGDGRAGAGAEDVAAFHSAKFAAVCVVPAEVEDVDAGEFVGKAGPESIHGVAINEGAVGDKANDSLVCDAVACPAYCPNVTVVETVF